MWKLQHFDVETFVREHWQKQPCVIRNAFPDFASPISAEELAGLACEEDVHCRLVVEKDAATPWQVRYGPFEEQDFTTLPPADSQNSGVKLVPFALIPMISPVGTM